MVLLTCRRAEIEERQMQEDAVKDTSWRRVPGTMIMDVSTGGKPFPKEPASWNCRVILGSGQRGKATWTKLQCVPDGALALGKDRNKKGNWPPLCLCSCEQARTDANLPK